MVQVHSPLPIYYLERFVNVRALNPEPRWPAICAVLAIAGLYYALPHSLTLGPPWLLGAIALAMVVPVVITHWSGNVRANKVFGYGLLAILTVFMIFGVAYLVDRLCYPDGNPLDPIEVLRSAFFLWISNVILFALWYWRLDAGGPHHREQRERHEEGAFLFPQMNLSPEQLEMTSMENWSPNFLDYLFLAFNTSTALSPADTGALSRWAKALMMIQSLTSLSIIVLLAARAVNLLSSR